MITYIIYFIVTLFATMIGAIAGLGGGLIIKPVLDFLNDYDISTINVLSSISVLTMTSVSLFKSRHKIKNINPKLLSLLAVSSFIGGLVGSSMFTKVVESYGSDITKFSQSILLILILVVVILLNVFKNRIHLNIHPGVILSLLCGFLLGLLGSFLGIGGGPLNVLVLILIFRYTSVNASIGSLFTIFFAQLSSLLKISVTSGFSEFDLSMLIVMLPAAILGGLIGTIMLSKINPKYISYLFTATILFVILINIFNLFK